MSLVSKKYRKNIYFKITKIKKQELYFQIYQTILTNKEPHNINNNGVFFDLYKISLKSIQEIDKILQVNEIYTEEETPSYHNYSDNTILTDTIDVTGNNSNDDIFSDQTALPISQIDKL